MKSEKITVSGKGEGVGEALALTEETGIKSGLDKKSVLRLRLLAEELFGMLSGIAGDIRAEYRIESEKNSFELRMKADVKMTDEMRAQLLSVSKDGKNYAKKGFMGRIKVMIADFLTPLDNAPPQLMMDAVMPYPMGSASADASCVWSMVAYKEQVGKRRKNSEEAAEAWDELERSIVANIADDVKVGVFGTTAEIIVFKTFG